MGSSSGFARDILMSWCENNGVDFLFGLARNRRLVGEIEVELAAAETESKQTSQPARRFKAPAGLSHASLVRRRRRLSRTAPTITATPATMIGTSAMSRNSSPPFSR